MEKTLLTIDISHGSTHDGPGLRTTVFTKGCPLHCKWCQNPESISAKNELWWDSSLCLGCHLCIRHCPSQALHVAPTGIQPDKRQCTDCGLCTELCPSGAIHYQGHSYDMAALLKEVLSDRAYYEQFGGGVTCSGGEPLLQHSFVTAFFKQLKEEGIHTALDTCGAFPLYHLQSVLLWTDLLLYDLKLFDPYEHLKWTGQDNVQILQNLLSAAEFVRSHNHPLDIWIRTPLIPGATASVSNIKAIGTFINTHLSDLVTRWELCAFNNICAAKYKQLGLSWDFADTPIMTTALIEPLYEAACSVMPKEKVHLSGIIR